MKWILLGAALLCGVAHGQDTLLGAGLRTRPEFEGSDRQKADVIPVLRYYGEPWFARTTQDMLEGGVQWKTSELLAAGAQIAYEPGPLDEDPGASAGIHLELDTKLGRAPLNGLVRLRWHLQSERGKEADVRMTLGVYEGGGLRAGVFAQGTWADEENVAAYYGVRQAGLLFTSLGVLGGYDIAPRWVAVASAELRRLGSDPAESAIVEDRTGYWVSAGIAYRF
jgi:outer membrane scaffolding protein for murein synthesis (MipA/OmpV family)